jgi:hypothetical protein
MQLSKITARAHADGNGIDLSWTNPDPAGFPGVRVVRREGTHAVNPNNEGTVVAHGTGFLSWADRGLKGETVYYYSLFPFHGSPPEYDIDPRNRASAMATAPYDFAGQMYALLPAVYHRYDQVRQSASGAALAPADQDKGPLRRFLDLPGAQFDQIYSLARAALGLHELDRAPGNLLPLLAQWIGWRTDYSLEVGEQRNEIRFAPQIYQTIGLVPTVEATVKRITGWESRTKEFVHNVARTNHPERLNLWSMVRSAGGNFGTAELASLNAVYEGRPSAVRETDGTISLFYHTHRRRGWNIWTKRFVGGQWQPSAPVVDQPSLDKNPSAAVQGGRLWLFWENYDQTQPNADRKWRINFRTRVRDVASAKDVWSPISVFGDSATERRSPTAVMDNAGGLWLFWLEQTAMGWGVKYNRHDGNDWLASPVALPLDAGNDLRVERDLYVLFHPTSVNQRFWLFWARQDAGGPSGQSRWTIQYRIKQGLNPTAADWSAVRTLPKATPDNREHDREPCAILVGNNIELFWSSTRAGGWTLWNAILDTGTFNWSATHQLVATPYSNRAPLAIQAPTGTLLAYRSNESLPHVSSVYGATRTLDARYGGTTTVDTRNTTKLALRGTFEDFQTYTCDSGQNGVRSNDDRIARDTIGIYLTSNPNDPTRNNRAQIAATTKRLASVLGEFLPITERAVFIPPPP